ncbi:hypothetical protein B0H11DRAFT_1907774 [Mycena galericulata]|nr:hypothetical protein B0H11DRAFT_1907774 [Mycena galericulata]
MPEMASIPTRRAAETEIVIRGDSHGNNNSEQDVVYWRKTKHARALENWEFTGSRFLHRKNVRYTHLLNVRVIIDTAPPTNKDVVRSHMPVVVGADCRWDVREKLYTTRQKLKGQTMHWIQNVYPLRRPSTASISTETLECDAHTTQRLELRIAAGEYDEERNSRRQYTEQARRQREGGTSRHDNFSTIGVRYIEEVVEERTWLFCWHATIDGVMADPQAIGIHASYTCPEKAASHIAGTRTTPATKKCYKCSGGTHIARECPKETQCYNCKEMGQHISRECPHPQKCHCCGKEGHEARGCQDILDFAQKFLEIVVSKREIWDNFEVWLRDDLVRGVRGAVGCRRTTGRTVRFGPGSFSCAKICFCTRLEFDYGQLDFFLRWVRLPDGAIYIPVPGSKGKGMVASHLFQLLYGPRNQQEHATAKKLNFAASKV